MHLEAIQKRLREVVDRNDSDVSKLMYRLRNYALEVAYFPQKMDRSTFPISLSEHPGWRETMTDVERDILDTFSRVIFRMKKFGVTDDVCTDFTRADKLFGVYRYHKWLLRR